MKRSLIITSTVMAAVLWCVASHAAEYRTDEIIVKFKASRPNASSAQVCPEPMPTVIAVEDADKAIAELMEEGAVEYAEPNYIIEAEDIPDDWPYAGMWPQISIESAWDFLASCERTGGVTVAVVDSGVDLRHPDLAGVLVDGYDFVSGDGTPEDNSGHGTKVCGVLGAIGANGYGIAGVAWNVDLAVMPLKFMDKDVDGKTTGTLSDAIKAIYFAVDHGADIINASWGFYERSRALDDALAYARSRGVLVVSSAGNKGQDNDTHDHYPSNSPQDNVVAVAALGTDGTLAPFSNYGAKNVDVAAPGAGIVTTMISGGYVSWVSGTSFSTPFVSGIAAMILACSPGMDPAVVRDVLVESCRSAPAAASFAIAGGGCVNAYEALLLAEDTDSLSKAASSGQDTQGSPDESGSSGSSGSGCVISAAAGAPSPGVLLLFAIWYVSLVLFRSLPARDPE